MEVRVAMRVESMSWLWFWPGKWAPHRDRRGLLSSVECQGYSGVSVKVFMEGKTKKNERCKKKKKRTNKQLQSSFYKNTRKCIK